MARRAPNPPLCGAMLAGQLQSSVTTNRVGGRAASNVGAYTLGVRVWHQTSGGSASHAPGTAAVGLCAAQPALARQIPTYEGLPTGPLVNVLRQQLCEHRPQRDAKPAERAALPQVPAAPGGGRGGVVGWLGDGRWLPPGDGC